MNAWRPPIPINPERISKLAQLGLNEQQARAYLSLLDVDTATVNDIAKESRVPRAKLYEVLETLNRKGLIEVIPETPQRFRANPPTALYDTRLAELRSEERQLRDTIGELMLQLLPGGKERAGDLDRDFLHLVRGRTPLVTAFKQLVERSERTLHILGDPLFLPRLKLYDETYRAVAHFQAKGQLRILIPSNAVRAVEGRKVHADELADAVRILPFPMPDAMIAVRDHAEVIEAHLLPNDLHPSRGSDRVVVHRDAALATAASSMIVGLWPTATAYVSGLAGRA
ncbi:MAG TPA: helix-turn-helix domain-containing protein [Candidatus Thermoplasmatota archaeon]|nr:helix-turn-helix domain-containing protein [Candidatus Thermoplasmatota archaeon]